MLYLKKGRKVIKMAMTPSKRHQARARAEALQKARKDERLGLTKKGKTTKKKRK